MSARLCAQDQRIAVGVSWVRSNIFISVALSWYAGTFLPCEVSPWVAWGLRLEEGETVEENELTEGEILVGIATVRRNLVAGALVLHCVI